MSGSGAKPAPKPDAAPDANSGASHPTPSKSPPPAQNPGAAPPDAAPHPTPPNQPTAATAQQQLFCATPGNPCAKPKPGAADGSADLAGAAAPISWGCVPLGAARRADRAGTPGGRRAVRPVRRYADSIRYGWDVFLHARYPGREVPGGATTTVAVSG